MSVVEFDPSALEVTLTDSAIAHARNQVAATASLGIRLGVREAGCSGFMYEVSTVAESGEDDVSLEIADGVRLFVARDAVSKVNGTIIDYVTEGLNSVMKFDNPNAHSLCGCGESFAVG